MPLFTKRKTKLHLQLTNSDQATAHGGQVLVDALCRRFGLWQRVHDEPSLELRKRTGAGFSPVANDAQLLFTLTSGGASLADAERLGKDRVLMDLLGLEKGADQTTLGEWLRAQTRKASGRCTGSTPSWWTGPASRPSRDAGCTAAKWRPSSTTPKSKSRDTSSKVPASTTRATGP